MFATLTQIRLFELYIYIYIYNETRSKLFYIHTCTDLCIYIYTEGFIRNDKLFICSTKNEH